MENNNAGFELMDDMTPSGLSMKQPQTVLTTLRKSDHDASVLARTGKRQVLKRRFGLGSMIGFSCTLMCTWESVLVAFSLGLQNGGPAGLVYGFLFSWLGTISVFIAMGELSSMMPTAGGQYHWVSILAPERAKLLLSYMTGWITVAGWIAALTATAFFVSSLVLGLITQNNPDFVATGWQGTLLFWAVLLVCVLFNTEFSSALPAIEVLILILHVMGFFAIIIPLVYLSPHSSASYVFTEFQNLGGWQTQTLSFFIGLNGNAVAFIGTDGAIHMSEEIKSATVNVPRSMLISVFINGALGFAILLATLFCIGDFDVTTIAPSGYPFISIIANGLGSNSAANFLVSSIIVLEACSAIGALAASSRMMWSFARDHGMPGWKTLGTINDRTQIPLASIIVVTSCAILLGLINIGSTVAFNDVVSLVLETFYASYLLSCGLLLYRRVRGDIGFPNNDEMEPSSSGKPYTWGPWRMPGTFGIINNIFACVYLLIIAFFSYWPATLVINAASMNYTALVTGVVVLFSIGYYYIWARKIYTGPIVEIVED